jgi:transglutaminase-like putative cysteine protease
VETVRKNLITIALCAALLLTGMAIPALADWERSSVVLWEEQAASEYLVENGILQGDDSGNLSLDKGLTRAELAAVLWRLNGMDKPGAGNGEFTAEEVNNALASGRLGFTDVPGWAEQYVMYCKLKGLMRGYSDTRFGSNDPVSVKAICAVILRRMGYGDSDGTWTYDTSLTKAQAVGIAPALLADTGSVRRGDMAVIVYRAATGNLIPVTVPVPPDGDYSKDANPDVFDDRIFTRELYNALRAAYLGYANNDVIFRLGTSESIDLSVLLNGWTFVYGDTGSKKVTVNPYVAGWQIYHLSDEVAANRDTFISSLQGLSDVEKVERINQYISDHITYKVTLAGNNWNEFFTTGIEGDCENFTLAASHLFYKAGIPCIPVVGYLIDRTRPNHIANMIYINGQWQFYDAASSESLGSLVLGTDEQNAINFTPTSPRLNRFAMEAALPGSTK